MKECIYYFKYINNEFYGYVMGPNGLTVYEIEDEEHMLNILESGEMLHIDDIEGLEKMLKSEEILDEDYIITFGGLLE